MSLGAKGTQRGTGFVEAEYTDSAGKLWGIYVQATSAGNGHKPTDFIDDSELPHTEEEIVAHLNENCLGYYRINGMVGSLKSVGGRIVRRLTVREEEEYRNLSTKERNARRKWEKPAPP